MTKLALALALAQPLRAEPILFRGPHAPDLDYRARLHAEEAMHTPTQAYLAQHPTPAARELLLARFTRAQSAFLDDSAGEARRHFQEVVALLPTEDWQKSDREIFLHAYLRLAQLEFGAPDREHWLEQARFLGPDLAIQTDLFPPPLVARYRALGVERGNFTPDVRGLGWPLLLLNGVPCRPYACPSFPRAEGPVRVTFLSDQWQPQTVHVDLGTLAHRRPPRVAWVEGSCPRGTLTVAARELGPGRPFFGVACDAGAPAPPPTFAPGLPSVRDPGTELARSVTSPPPGPARRPFYKSPWLWVGIGAVALTAIAVSVRGSGRHDPSQPTSAPPPPPSPSPAPAPTGDRPPTVVYGL